MVESHCSPSNAVAKGEEIEEAKRSGAEPGFGGLAGFRLGHEM